MGNEREEQIRQRESGFSEAELDKDVENSSNRDAVKAKNIFDSKKKKNKN